MNKAFLTSLIVASTMVLATSVHAQEEDNTQTLPDAKPGECFAKVITPAKFANRSEEIVVKAATQRVESVPAEFESIERTVITKEASKALKVIPAVFAEKTERLTVRPAETSWLVQGDKDRQPASPGMLEGIAASGNDLKSVKPGSCFREYYTQPEYKTETMRVMVREEEVKISITPAQYETAEERVMVQEATTRSVDVPAVFRTETESVLVEPARSVWKKGRGPVERINNSTGEIMCLVEIPARYETITKTVLEKPPTTQLVDVPAEFKTIQVRRLVKPAAEQRTTIPAEYKSVTTRTKVADAGFFWLSSKDKASKGVTYSGNEVCLVERPAETTTVKKLVVSNPATTKEIEVPAKSQTVSVKRLVNAATERRFSMPAKTKTVNRRVQVEPSRLEWRKVLCETNITPKIVTSIQRALEREGFNPGAIDGALGSDTLAAVEKYQLKRNLDRGGLTYETLKALKVVDS